MTTKTKTVLLRAARSLGAVAAAFTLKEVASPDILNIVGSHNSWIITVAVVPGLLAAEKWLRYGSDPGETTTPSA